MTAAYLEKLLILTFRAAACPSVGNDDIMSDQKGGSSEEAKAGIFYHIVIYWENPMARSSSERQSSKIFVK